MRNAILDAKDIDEFLKITAEIYKQAGINVVFDIDVELDEETGVPYPIFSIADAGHGGRLAYRSKTDTTAYKNIYTNIISRYLDEIGAATVGVGEGGVGGQHFRDGNGETLIRIGQPDQRDAGGQQESGCRKPCDQTLGRDPGRHLALWR